MTLPKSNIFFVEYLGFKVRVIYLTRLWISQDLISRVLLVVNALTGEGALEIKYSEIHKKSK